MLPIAVTAAPSDPAFVTLVWSAIISGSVVAAVIGALASTYLARRKSREEQLARVRVMLAEAFQTVAEYKEFPYAIRRRRHDAASEERVRLSEEMTKVQSKLTFYLEWTRIENQAVGAAYGDLVHNLRLVAGTACNEAWRCPAIETDKQMNIPREQVDLTKLIPFEYKYTDTAQAYVKDYMRWSKWRMRPS